MGPFFFLYISVGQLVWITFIFLSISMATSGLSELSDICEFLSYFLMAISTTVQVTAVIFCLDDCHKSLVFLEESLTADIVEMETGKERQEAEILLKVGLM